MAKGRKPKNNNGAKLGFEEQLWAMVDTLRTDAGSDCGVSAEDQDFENRGKSEYIR